MPFDAEPPEDRQAYAARVLDLIQQAMECCNGTHTLADIRKQIEARRLELWIGEEGRAVGITEIIRYPQGPALNVFLSAGDMEEIKRCLPGLEAYARGKGCMAVMFYGRAGKRTGWSPLLEDCGFRPVWVCMWKDLK